MDRDAGEMSLLAASVKGSVDAGYHLGVMYQQDSNAGPFKARTYLQKTAVEGHRDEQYRLGKLLIDEKTFPIGKEWLEKASNGPKRHPEARCALGKLYETGVANVIPKDESKAKEYFLLAANQEDQEVQYCLGLMYREGRGGEQNKDEAIGWFVKVSSDHNFTPVDIQPDLSRPYDDINRDNSGSLKSLTQNETVSSLSSSSKTQETSGPIKNSKENSEGPLSDFFGGVKDSSSLTSPPHIADLASSVPGTEIANKEDEQAVKKDRFRFRISPQVHHPKRTPKQQENSSNLTSPRSSEK